MSPARPICPRPDCNRPLRESPYAPPGAFECPDHGGPIWFQEQGLELATDALPNSSRGKTDMQAVLAWLARLGLYFSVDRDLSGNLPTVVTVENLPPDTVDVRFSFDQDGKLLQIGAHIDPRTKATGNPGPTF